ncbi:beta transducin, partial [Coemansia aciculifera]
MVKSYLRYSERGVFGVIASPSGNAVFDHSGKLSITAALESVIVWDIKKGTQVGRWSDSDNKAEVTCIGRSPNGKDYAVGYADGTIRLFDLDSNTVKVVLSGHRGRVTALEFDRTGMVLASGARDTDMILWDVVGEVGLYRLRGHKDEITGIAFVASGTTTAGAEAPSALHASSAGYVVSSSKDTLVKLWDLRGRHCVQTLATHRSEVWGLAVSPDGRLLVTGTSESSLRVWTLDVAKLDSLTSDRGEGEGADLASSDWEAISEYGAVQRASSDRVVGLKFHPSGQYFACAGADKQVEVFRARQQSEIKKKMARRQKRQREKGAAEDADDAADTVTASDELTPFKIIRTSAKPVSLDFGPAEVNSAIHVLVAQNNNSLHLWAVPVPPPGKTTKQAALGEPALASSVEMLGHRSEPRALALSSDNELVASAANKSLRVWNALTGSCVRTLECGTAVCAAFLPGDQHIVVGTRDGQLELYDIPAAALVETFDAHDGAACWSIDVRTDGKGLVTGGADKSVKFWDFEL